MRRRRSGFTLIEMVVVIAILVILTGLVVAKLDVFEMKANKGVSAANMAGIARYVQTYRTLSSQYPDGWDSLLVNGTSLPLAGPPNGTPGLHPELTGGSPFVGAPITELATTTLTASEVQSLGRLFVATLYDFPAVAQWTDIPGNMATIRRALTTGSTVATLNATIPTDGVTPVTQGDPKAIAVISHIYPNPGAGGPIVPANKQLVVFGLGRFNTLIGSTNQNGLLTEAPFYANTNQVQYYNRFLVVFEVDTTGSRCREVAVLGGDGDQMTDEIADYYQQNP
jgi:prepilin-type N-terminal cleavage/methylation domain-containing protein